VDHDIRHDGLGGLRPGLAAFSAADDTGRSAQLQDIPVRTGIRLYPAAEMGMLLMNARIDDAEDPVRSFSAPPQDRGQEIVRSIENIPGKKYWKLISDAELLFKLLHGIHPVSFISQQVTTIIMNCLVGNNIYFWGLIRSLPAAPQSKVRPLGKSANFMPPLFPAP
jgi:hypothetical protein